jgi:heme O synthase-like polyprenyltransferase
LDATKALWFGIGLLVLGVLELGLSVNWLVALLGFTTLAMYLFLYTPLKQKT